VLYLTAWLLLRSVLSLKLCYCAKGGSGLGVLGVLGPVVWLCHLLASFGLASLSHPLFEGTL